MFCECSHSSTVTCCNLLFCESCLPQHFTLKCIHSPQQLSTSLDQATQPNPSHVPTDQNPENIQNSSQTRINPQLPSNPRPINSNEIQNSSNFFSLAENEKFHQKKKFLQSHNGGFLCLVISYDEKKIVTGSDDTTVRVWDLVERNQIQCWAEHQSDVICLAISKDSSFVVSGSEDRSLVLWDLERNRLRFQFKGHSCGVYCVALSFDESFMVSGSYELEMMIWSMETFMCVRKIFTDGGVYSLLVINEREFYSAIGYLIEKWDMISFNRSHSIQCHKQQITSITTTHNKDLLITSSEDKKLKLWHIPSLQKKATLLGHSAGILSVCVTSDDSYLLSSDEKFSIILWSMESLSQIHKFSHHSDSIPCIKYLNDQIISVSRDGRIGFTKLSSKTFDSYLSLKPFTTGSEQQKENLLAYGSLASVSIWNSIENENENEILLEGHIYTVQAICFYHSMKKLVSASRGSNKNLIVWDLLLKCEVFNLEGHRSTVFCVDVSFDDFYAISGDAKGKVLYWDLDKMMKVCEFDGHCGEVYSVKFTKSRKFGASCGFDEKVVIWDLEDKVMHAVLNGHQDYVWKVSVTRDDECFVSGNFSEGIRVWSIRMKREVLRFDSLDRAKEWIEVNREIRSEFSRFLF